MAHSTYEIVETSDMIPFDVSLHYVNYVPRHWHHSIEIIFVLRGKLEVTVDHETHPLTEGDVLLINQNHVHEVIGLSSNIIATYLIPMSYLKKRIHGIETFEFDCHMSSVDAGKRSSLDKIRQLLAKIVQLKQQKGEAFELEMQARLLDVFAILMKQFKTVSTGTSVNEKHMERMLRIISFIDEHYRESMTLQRISEQEYLSVPYLSKFFREHIGENFRKYLTSIRLKNAVEDLLSHPTQPIVEVAMAHGFPNAKSFYSAFKSRYHMTPHTYREHYRRGSND